MNAEQLRKIIAKMVRAEMQPILRQEVRSYLSEVFSGNAHRPSNRPTSSDFSDETAEAEELPPVPQKPKKMVNYTSNPALNAILNETTGGIPQEGSMASMMGGFGRGSSEMINETAMPVVVPETAPAPVKNVAAVINRDFRSLMKAIDKKIADKKKP